MDNVPKLKGEPCEGLLRDEILRSCILKLQAHAQNLKLQGSSFHFCTTAHSAIHLERHVSSGLHTLLYSLLNINPKPRTLYSRLQAISKPKPKTLTSMLQATADTKPYTLNPKLQAASLRTGPTTSG